MPDDDDARRLSHADPIVLAGKSTPERVQDGGFLASRSSKDRGIAAGAAIELHRGDARRVELVLNAVDGDLVPVAGREIEPIVAVGAENDEVPAVQFNQVAQAEVEVACCPRYVDVERLAGVSVPVDPLPLAGDGRACQFHQAGVVQLHLQFTGRSRQQRLDGQVSLPRRLAGVPVVAAAQVQVGDL